MFSVSCLFIIYTGFDTRKVSNAVCWNLSTVLAQKNVFMKNSLPLVCLVRAIRYVVIHSSATK